MPTDDLPQHDLPQHTVRPADLRQAIAPEPEPDLPLIAGRYQLLRQLGEGGYGEVFVAHDAKFDQQVAVKLSTEVVSEHAFEREAKLIRAVEHPNVVRVHDYGTATIDGREQHFIAMELLDGDPLDAVLEEHGGRLPETELLRFARDMGSALEFCHEKGLVHRDLKPSNIQRSRGIAADGQQSQRFVLLDFGIASKPGSGNFLDGKTNDGAGTPEYMAPENLGAGGGPADQAVGPLADVYAFGAILYKALTGKRPFEIDGTSGLSELVRVASGQAPPKPSDVAPDRKIPAEVDELLLSCLAHNPEERPTSAREIGFRFRKAISPYSVSDSTQYEVGGTTRPKSKVPAITSAIGLLALAAAAVSGFLMMQPGEPKLVIQGTGADGQQVREAVAGEPLKVVLDVFRLGKRRVEVIAIRDLPTPPFLPDAGPTESEDPDGDGRAEFVLRPDLNAEPQEVDITFAAYIEGSEQPDDVTMRVRIVPPDPWSPPQFAGQDSGLVRTPSGQLAASSLGPLAETIAIDVPGLDRDGGRVLLRRVTPDEAGASPRDFRPFYIMEQKVGRDLFRLFAADDPDIAIPPQWDRDRERFPDSDRWPATHVSLAQAQRFARWLGGINATLPLVRQWHAAAGSYLADDLTAGPFGSHPAPGDDSISPPFGNRLVVHQPVTGYPDDVSALGVRQLCVNGGDLTRSYSEFADPKAVQELFTNLDADIAAFGYDAELMVCLCTGATDREPFEKIFSEDNFPVPRPLIELTGTAEEPIDDMVDVAFRVVVEVDESQLGTREYDRLDLGP